jgi:hypothetical protein
MSDRGLIIPLESELIQGASISSGRLIGGDLLV